MILSANQPYFAPSIGFLYKALLSDIFVILDSVQFPRGTTWLSRNRFKNDKGTLWITIPVWKKGLGLQKINEVKVYHESKLIRKHLAGLKSAYSYAPYFLDHLKIVEEVFSERYEKLIDLNLAIIRHFIAHFGIKTDLILLSELGIEERGDQLIISICKKMGADRFLAQRSAEKYLNIELFNEAMIDIEYFSPPTPVYPQLWGDFIHNLSAFDLLLNCGPKGPALLSPHRGA